MTSSLAARHGRLYQRMAADAATLKPRPGPASAVTPSPTLTWLACRPPRSGT